VAVEVDPLDTGRAIRYEGDMVPRVIVRYWCAAGNVAQTTILTPRFFVHKPRKTEGTACWIKCKQIEASGIARIPAAHEARIAGAAQDLDACLDGVAAPEVQ
jgi:hypothetical protein